jgi:hypothetical protein
MPENFDFQVNSKECFPYVRERSGYKAALHPKILQTYRVIN